MYNTSAMRYINVDTINKWAEWPLKFDYIKNIPDSEQIIHLKRNKFLFSQYL
jgi:hypothetical protein